MGTNYELLKRSFVAGGDIPAKRFVKVDGTLAGAGEAAIGVAEYAAQSGDDLSVIMSGVVSVEAGGTVNAGDKIASDENGKAVVASTGNTVVGIALESGGAGQEIEILLVPPIVVA